MGRAWQSHPRKVGVGGAGGKPLPLAPAPRATEPLSVLQDGLHKLVVSLDLLQEDHIEGGRVHGQQFSGPLIVDHFRDLLFHVSGQLEDLAQREL